MSRRGLYTIAPHGRFLDILADRILDGTLLKGWDRSGPFWLADVTIVLPTRRARLMLAEIFAQRLGGAALLPDIRTFGGDSSEEEPFLPPIDAVLPPPVASAIERRLTLSRLVRQFAISAEGFSTPPNAAEVLTLADSFGTLIDDLAIEGGDLGRLDPMMVGDLAQNWQDVLKFLEPALAAWPLILAGSGRIDAAEARNRRLMRQAETAPLLYGERPVIAAGSTGSIPATAALLGAIAALPRGAVVLPGLDISLAPAQHEILAAGADTHGHPQYGLATLLRGLGARIADVEELAGDDARTTIVRHALALTEETAGWAAARDSVAAALEPALAGVSIIAAPNADMEARAIALAARQALADGQSVGIISRDQTLARRISAELGRHDIEVDDPAGVPLFQSSAGRLARQGLTAAINDFAPVDTIALLRNGAVTLGMARNEIRRQANRLDLKLRGKRPRAGVAGLAEFADDEIRPVLDALGPALAPLTAMLAQREINAPALAKALGAAIEALVGHDADMPGLIEFRHWATELAAVSDGGAPFAPVILDSVLAALMAGNKVAPTRRRRDDIHIWGELEARLMNPDLMILAGLNEDIWPSPADPGPWLSRSMRIAVGLAPPERQQGQAAHDFVMALGNRQVILAFATRIGTSPALASRLVQRLDAFIGTDAAKALRQRGARWLKDAAALDFAGRPEPAKRPMPVPKAADRPRQLSITEIEPLMRSPYDIYAKKVLRLIRREPLGTSPDARERGSMIHKVFERFVLEGHGFAAPDALAVLQRMAEEEFAGLDAIGERRDIWLRRFRRAAELFLDYERGRTGTVSARTAEIRGEWIFPEMENFVLVGKADRIDQLSDGTLEIIDFKTGGVPAPADMKAFDAPQLLLEAAMARAGVFPGLPARPTSALTYIKIGLGPQAFQLMPFRLRDGMSLDDMVDEIERRLQGHVDAFLLHDHLPMAARIRPRPSTGRKPYPGDYDHLARTDEWTLTAGVDDP